MKAWQMAVKRWSGRVMVRLRRLVKQGETPEQTARAFAVGVFIAFTPTVGLHYLSAALAAWLFRFNVPALFAGATVNNPFTIAPLYGFCIWVGQLLVGGNAPMEEIDWAIHWSFSWAFFTQFEALLDHLKPMLVQFVVGTLIVGAVAGAISYWLFLRVARRRQQRLLQRAQMVKKPPGAAPDPVGRTPRSPQEL